MATPQGASSEQVFPMKRHESQDACGNNCMSMSVTTALRSRAIAIHPSKTLHPADLEEQHEQESVRIYDQATWRMYNRIVDHRRNNQAATAQTHSQPTVVSDNYQTLRSLQALHDDLDFRSNNIDGEDYQAEDGEIFQLDL